MADNSDDDLGAIAWPGFVDILSSVIIMFVFFLMIVAGALYIYTMIFISRLKSEIVIENTESDSRLLFEQQQAEFAETKDQRFVIDTDSNTITVFFGEDAISILPDTLHAITAALQTYDPTMYEIKITAPKPKLGLDMVHRKIAIARMLNLRNTVLETDFPPESAIPKLIRPRTIEDSLDWAQIQIIKRKPQD